MSVRAVVTYPNACLREVCATIDVIDEEVHTLIQDLKDTCKAYRAHGLAAPQIGVLRNVLVTHVDGEEEPTIFINPEIIEANDKGVLEKEGCLSFPGVEEVIPRFGDITVKSLNESGEEFTLSLDDLEAIALQHEYDHLNGVLFIDHVSSLKKRFMLKKLKKATKKTKKLPNYAAKRARARNERRRLKKHRRHA